MKIFMHWDMEGAAGIMSREHLWYWEDGVREEVAAEGRRLLTADVNAAAAAALGAGVDEVILCDTHHGGGNFLLDQILADPRITVLPNSVGYQGAERRWMPGLDESVDGLMLMGHHAKAGTPGAFLPHTQTLAWADVRINGQSVGEMGIEACYAGHWDVPPVLAQGTELACREAAALFPGVVTAAVKHAVSHDRCAGPDPETARWLTARKVIEAVEGLRAGRFAPYKPALPMTVTIRMHAVEDADAAAQQPGVERVDAHTVAKQVARRCDVMRWIVGQGLNMPTQGRS
jgi:D-amino peptidase